MFACACSQAVIDINYNTKVDEKVEVVVEDVEDPWSLVEPPKSGKDWDGKST